MKIDSNNELCKSVFPHKSNKNEQLSNTNFGTVLKETIEKENPAISQSGVQHASQMNPLSAVQFNPLSPDETITTLNRVQNFLELLDTYRQRLADPQVTLRGIEALIQDIEKEKEQLSVVLDSLPKADRLKDILKQTLVTASLEIIKFNRGDYIPS